MSKLERLVAAAAYVASVCLRRLFLSCKAGALIHNYVIFLAYRFMTSRSGREVPDVPEVPKAIERWRHPLTRKLVERIYDL
ncbi:MAG TPA: hypothetical protein VF303_02950, partial [Candidatus Nanoarchaeia archaeon]